jgi:hypothetical protein
MIGDPSVFTKFWWKGVDITASIVAGALSGRLTSNLFWKRRKKAELKMQQEFDLDTQKRLRIDREAEEKVARTRIVVEQARELWRVIHRDVDVAPTKTIAENTDALVRDLRELGQVLPDQSSEEFVKWNQRMARAWPRHDGPTILLDHVQEFRRELDKIKPYLFPNDGSQNR